MLNELTKGEILNNGIDDKEQCKNLLVMKTDIGRLTDVPAGDIGLCKHGSKNHKHGCICKRNCQSFLIRNPIGVGGREIGFMFGQVRKQI